MTPEEKQQLFEIITLVIGHDPSISALKTDFNEDTIQVVELMLADLANCNSAFKDILLGLMSGGRVATKGWLRKAIGTTAQAMKRVNLQFYTCSVSIKLKYSTPIKTSTI